jgi:hypothetical protein
MNGPYRHMNAQPYFLGLTLAGLPKKMKPDILIINQKYNQQLIMYKSSHFIYEWLLINKYIYLSMLRCCLLKYILLCGCYYNICSTTFLI